MSAYEDVYEGARGGHSILYYLFWVIVALLVFMILTPANTDPNVAFSLDHARGRHGQDADTVYECYKNNGPILALWNFATGRCANLVDMGDQGYGVLIDSADDPVVTAFRVGRNVLRVINYLLGRGYTMPMP